MQFKLSYNHIIAFFNTEIFLQFSNELTSSQNQSYTNPIQSYTIEFLGQASTKGRF